MFRSIFWSLSLFLYRLPLQVVIVKNCSVPVPWKAFCGKKSQPSAAMLFLAHMSHLPCKSGLQDSDSVQSLTLLGLWQQQYGLAI